MHLSEHERAIVVSILRKHVPGHKVRLFGSRATGARLKEFSDVDLALYGPPLSPTELGLLREALDQSSLPYKVDLVEWNKLNPDFQRVVDETSVPL